jgi:hypothetical protein
MAGDHALVIGGQNMRSGGRGLNEAVEQKLCNEIIHGTDVVYYYATSKFLGEPLCELMAGIQNRQMESGWYSYTDWPDTRPGTLSFVCYEPSLAAANSAGLVIFDNIDMREVDTMALHTLIDSGDCHVRVVGGYFPFRKFQVFGDVDPNDDGEVPLIPRYRSDYAVWTSEPE